MFSIYLLRVNATTHTESPVVSFSHKLWILEGTSGADVVRRALYCTYKQSQTVMLIMMKVKFKHVLITVCAFLSRCCQRALPHRSITLQFVQLTSELLIDCFLFTKQTKHSHLVPVHIRLPSFLIKAALPAQTEALMSLTHVLQASHVCLVLHRPLSTAPSPPTWPSPRHRTNLASGPTAGRTLSTALASRLRATLLKWELHKTDRLNHGCSVTIMKPLLSCHPRCCLTCSCCF